MSSYEVVATKILKYLNDCYETGQVPRVKSLNAKSLRITGKQYDDTLKMLSEDSFIAGIEFFDGVSPKYSSVNDPSNWQITRLGIEYFKENSLITKTYKQLKEIKDWLPLT
ncbi:YjcQ family protein [Ligilactobacillus hayakitensis]|uniref:YjcQ family protein n=1 Tax=Ligilactobacillus hayakitensis TaxID=396716 RepID=UPI0007054F3F|nr:YjcQ family protein [Ligilactobacillus hayakitensis]